MQFSITTLSMAPMITGHPLGLPEGKRTTKSPLEIKPITKRGDVDTAVANARTPAEFRRAVSGKPEHDRAAPPSMLQIRISQLLAEEIAPPQPGEVRENAARDQPKDPAVTDAPAREAEPAVPEVTPALAQPARAYPALPDIAVPQLDKAT
ncbi:hypothetical protein [Citreimonas sp.]|uniref:hypothetical protein n=1 Tax=Citreimonas sp. TaxID=3036715 RepID=UPI0035C852DC